MQPLRFLPWFAQELGVGIVSVKLGMRAVHINAFIAVIEDGNTVNGGIHTGLIFHQRLCQAAALE